MTRKPRTPPATPLRSPAERLTGLWPLQDAKARFSEVVRRAHSEGPQHVTVHGREEAVVVSAEEFRHLKGGQTGQSLIDALQQSPYREIDLEIDLEARRDRMPVRPVDL